MHEQMGHPTPMPPMPPVAPGGNPTIVSRDE
jgi:hypothetical protein